MVADPLRYSRVKVMLAAIRARTTLGAPGGSIAMKSIVVLAAILFAGQAFAQSAPVAAPAADAPQAEQVEPQASQDTQQAGAATPAQGQQVPTVPVQSEKPKNTTAIILGSLGAAALLGAASSSGGSDTPPPNPQPQPSSP